MSYRPIDYTWMQLQRQQTPQIQPPSLTLPQFQLPSRLWQLPPWTTQLGNTAILNTPPPPVIQLPPLPQIQLRLPDWGDLFPSRGGTRTDIITPTYQPPFDISTWLREQEIRNMPPGLRELYAALLGAGRYAVITPSIDVLGRWLKGEDPTKGLEEFEKESEAAAYASPWGHLVGQGIGLAGVAGLTAEGLIARGAGAADVERLLSGLRSSLKPAAVGAGVGVGAGAAEGVLTGRDPFAEASKFGSLGFLTGLGGVPWERLAAAGILGGVVGGSTAGKYGVEKGLETGSTVFFLPIVAPVERGLGGIAMGTRRSVLQAELANQVPIDWVRLRRGMSLEEAALYASELRFDPETQREFFAKLVEEALSRQRAGDVGSIVQLRYLREWLDPVSRPRFDEVLRQYGLLEIKHKTPEYGLEDETAAALKQFLKTRTPEYALTDESAKLLNQFLKTRQESQYALTDEAAARLDQLLRQGQRLAYRPTTWLDQLLRQKATPKTVQPTINTTSTTGAAAQTGTSTTQTTTANTMQTPNIQPSTTTTAATSTVVNERNVLQFVQYLPPQLLALPVVVALPIVARLISGVVGAPVTLRLPPPPNPNMSLGAYLRMLYPRVAPLSAQREVYVLL